MNLGRVTVILFSLGILSLYMFVGVWTAFALSPTQDEPLHLASGYSYWQENDFRMQPENGLLSQRLIGLGVLAAGSPEEIDTEGPLWKSGHQWSISSRFLEKGGKPVLVGGRIVILIAGALLLVLIFLLARSLWGSAAGLVALGFGAFSPTFLAHATLATSDVFLSLTYFAASCALISLLRRPSGTRILLAGFLCGLTALSKYSAVVLVPASSGILFLLWFIRGRPPAAKFFIVRLGSLLASAALAYGVIWCGYGFRYQAFNPDLNEGQFDQEWSQLRTDSLPSKTIAFFEAHRVFPEAYLYGAEHTYFFSRDRAAFFLGEIGPGGYRLYFPLALLLKTGPVFLIVLLALLILGLSRKGRGWKDDENPCRTAEMLGGTFVAAGCFLLFCVFSNLNIGNRHMLPVFPFLFLWSGALVPLLAGWRWRFWLIGSMLGVHALLAVWIAPSFLSYFNLLAGGSKEGYKYYADSSYDWGQEMYVLADWLAENEPDSAPMLALFAPMKPEYYGIRGRCIFQSGAGYPVEASAPVLSDGLLAVSATILSGPYFRVATSSWDKIQEENYWLSRSAMGEAVQAGGDDPEAWLDYFESRPEVPWGMVVSAYSRLRIKRLLYLISMKKPFARPSDTIFIWKVEKEDLARGKFDSEPTIPDSISLPDLLRSWQARKNSDQG